MSIAADASSNPYTRATVHQYMVLSRRTALCAVAGFFGSASYLFSEKSAEGDFWNSKSPETWSTEEIEHLTSRSPWARPVTAQIKGYAPMGVSSAPGNRRRGGTTGQSTGRAGASSADSSPKFQGVVRWASAKPIRLALKLQFSPSLANHYVISVTGLPVVSGHGGDDASDGSHDSYDGLKAQTSLQVKGQEPIQPGVIEPDKNETSTLYFGFLPELLQLDGERTVTFTTVMAPLNVKVKFELKEMKFKGDLAI